jgi:putative ABC transport system ATP-binding protein
LSEAALDLAVEQLRHGFPGRADLVVDLAAWPVAAGRQAAITGASGSGKTTLLYLLTGLERPTSGRVRWGDTDLAALDEAGRDAWRRRHVGFVFQDFHLIPGLSVAANVLVSCWFVAWSATPGERARAAALIEEVGVPAGRRDVRTLSRGEQQRVAVARALLHDPAVLVCDEPTASLDQASGAAVLEILTRAAGRRGATLLTVTHDPAVIEAMDEVHRLDRGRLERLR